MFSFHNISSFDLIWYHATATATVPGYSARPHYSTQTPQNKSHHYKVQDKQDKKHAQIPKGQKKGQ